MKSGVLSLYAFKYDYDCYLICEPHGFVFFPVEWVVVINTLRGCWKDTVKSCMKSACSGAWQQKHFFIISSISEAAPEAHFSSDSLGEWSCQISLLFSDMFARSDGGSESCFLPPALIMGKKILRRLDQPGQTNLTLLDTATQLP